MCLRYLIRRTGAILSLRAQASIVTLALNPKDTFTGLMCGIGSGSGPDSHCHHPTDWLTPHRL